MDDREFMISYITEEVKKVLQSLPSFQSVKDWCKDLSVLFNFQFYEFGCLPSLQQRQVVRHGFTQSSQVLEGLQVLL